MAGGAGERFWPLSRHSYPKQLVKIAGNRSMLGAAVERILPVVAAEDIYIITGRSLKRAIEAESGPVPAANVIAEPEGRNTSACLALAVALAEARYPDEADTVMTVVTADHFINQLDGFARDCETAIRVAELGDYLVTFGITPDRPETGYGYVEMGEKLFDGVHRVAAFREKPNAETAVEYLNSGRHLWNSGMFVWRTSSLSDAFRHNLPEAHAQIEPLRAALSAPNGEEAMAKAFGCLPKISIDYGVLERAANVAVVQAGFDWDDIGTWTSVARLLSADESGNVLFGNALAVGSRNSTIYSVDASKGPDSGRLVVGFNVEDLVIVCTDDAVLVFPRDSAQQVKDVVANLRAKGMEKYL